jgi:hypothetical protein
MSNPGAGSYGPPDPREFYTGLTDTDLLTVAEQKLAAIRELMNNWKVGCGGQTVGIDFVVERVLAILDGTPKPIEELIEASSLGTPAAKAARESVSDEDTQRIIDRVNEMRGTEGKQ